MRWIKWLASGLGLGYLPKAPGTWGTLLGIPLFYLGASFPWLFFFSAVVLLTGLAVGIAQAAGKIWEQPDDSRIVIDEVVGYLAGALFVPWSPQNALLLFLLFRLFDITKLPPARFFDRQVKNGLGVVLDDIVAGLYAGLSAQGILTLWSRYGSILG